MRVLSLHPNLPRYWLKLSSCYTPDRPSAVYSCLCLAQQHSTAQTAVIVDRNVQEFLEKHPAFQSKKSLVKESETALVDDEPSEEFTDLGTSQRAREKEDVFKKQGTASSATVCDPQLFIAEFEAKWFK